MPANILFVCTGNICRSPFAAAYAADKFAEAGLAGFATTSSAGSQALVGAACPSPLTERALDYRIDLRNHAGRTLTARDVEEAGLVLGLAREHRRAAIKAFPRASRYSFTLREFARLSSGSLEPRGEADPRDDLRASVRSIAARRGLVPAAADALDDDVIDPYGRGTDTYNTSLAQIVDAVDRIVHGFRIA